MEKTQETTSFWTRLYDRFLKIRGGPREVSLGLSLGIFLGMSPLVGLQTVLAVFLSSLFKWSKIAAALGTWISNPLTMPFIYGGTYALGARIIGTGGTLVESGDSGFSMFLNLARKSPEILLDMMVGGIVVGLPLAVLAYFVTNPLLMKHHAGLREAVLLRREKRREKRKALARQTIIANRRYNKTERRKKKQKTSRKKVRKR